MTLKAARGRAEGTAVAGGDPAAGDAAEHPGSAATPDSTATHPDSTATMRREVAEMIDSFASIRWGRRTA